MLVRVQVVLEVATTTVHHRIHRPILMLVIMAMVTTLLTVTRAEAVLLHPLLLLLPVPHLRDDAERNADQRKIVGENQDQRIKS
jgi:hypothetical protein